VEPANRGGRFGGTDVVEFDPGLGLSLQVLWRR